ncbi:MAG: hypothetical protein ACFCUU_13970 [Cyclobacteriaceae bacterium]
MHTRLKKVWSISLSLLAFIVGGCVSGIDEEDPIESGLRYFPMEVGKYNTYDVLVIDYALDGNNDTTRYQLKEQYVGTFNNLSGQLAYFLHRFKRTTMHQDWELDSVMSAYIDNNRVIVNENSLLTIKMMVPVGNDVSWDANLLNGRNAEIHTMRSVGQPFTLENVNTMASTLQVVESEEIDNLLLKDHRFRFYAENVGLILQESVTLQYCSDSDCIGDFIIEGGRLYKKTILEYGVE